MPAHIDTASRLHDSEADNFRLNCPHCQRNAHVSPFAVPSYQQIIANRPLSVGVVYSCDVCHASIFLRYAVRVYGDTRIELAPHFQQIERPRERFPFQYLPPSVQSALKEALLCHAADAPNAFALMCRRIVQVVHDDLGDASRLRMFEQINDLRDMIALDEESFAMLKRTLFAADVRSAQPVESITAWQAGLLLEVIKDLLNQAYVRKARLQQAMRVRKFFASEARDADRNRAASRSAIEMTAKS